MGFATLVPQGGATSMTVADVDGVQIAGLIFDAGVTSSPVLLQVGTPGATRVSHQSNPTSLNDVFFRIGGATAGTAVTSLEVDSNNVILDNIWAWRADHGAGSNPIWTGNPAAHGLVVNGDNVTALGLAVEHYQQEQTLWNGNGGETIFYQSELPYDVPSQSAWKDGAANGYPSYVVANSVTTHQAWGIGVYSFFNQGLNIIDDNAILVPNTTGVVMHDLLTVFLSKQGFGQITHVIDNTGNVSNISNADVAQTVTTYGGVACTTNCAPAAPTNLTATATSTSTVNLSWTASSTAGVTYSIFRSTTSGFTPGAATQIATGQTGTTFADAGLASNTTFYYLVQAKNSNGAATSNQASVTTNTSQPNPPTNLTATAVSSSQINLSWTASTTPGVTYEVFASTTSGFTPSEGTLLASTAGTTYASTGLKAGTTYYFAVEALGATNSTPARASATTQGGIGSGTAVSIDSGSSAAVGAFLADTDFTGGSTYTPGATVTVPAGLANAAPAAVYSTARQGNTFTYTVPGFVANSTGHTVTLHFAELYFSTAGSRKFNVAVNGTPVASLQNVDIFAAAGGKDIAVTRQVTGVTANAQGQITVTFSVGSVDQPMVSGVAIQ